MAIGHPIADDSQRPVRKFVNQPAGSFGQRLFDPALNTLNVDIAGIETRIINRRLIPDCRHFNTSWAAFYPGPRPRVTGPVGNTG